MSADSSKFDTKNDKGMLSQTVRELEDEVVQLKAEDKFKEYCINHLKAEIRLLRDTLANIEGASKKSLYKYEAMNEILIIQLENGYHMNHDGDEIHYVGENTPLAVPDMKRKR